MNDTGTAPRRARRAERIIGSLVCVQTVDGPRVRLEMDAATARRWFDGPQRVPARQRGADRGSATARQAVLTAGG